MTKSEFDIKFDECYSSFLHRIVETDLIAKRLKELSDGKNRISSEELVSSVLILSLELNAALLRSVLQDSLKFDD